MPVGRGSQFLCAGIASPALITIIALHVCVGLYCKSKYAMFSLFFFVYICHEHFTSTPLQGDKYIDECREEFASDVTNSVIGVTACTWQHPYIKVLTFTIFVVGFRLFNYFQIYTAFYFFFVKPLCSFNQNHVCRSQELNRTLHFQGKDNKTSVAMKTQMTTRTRSDFCDCTSEYKCR